MASLRSTITRLRRRTIYRRCLAAPSRAIILRYHSVGEPDAVTTYVDPALSLPPERFREHLRLLRRRFRIVSLDEILKRLISGESGDRIAAITFDDGYRDNHDVALPILLSEGATATFFVTSRPLEQGRWFWISELRGIVPQLPSGRLHVTGLEGVNVPSLAGERQPTRRALTRLMSAMSEQAREQAMDALAERASRARGSGLKGTFLTPDLLQQMVRQGMTIGAHTRSHPHLDRLDGAAFEDEVAGGKADLERAAGGVVAHFAHPNPGGEQRLDGRVRHVLEAAGFHTAVTSQAAPMTWRTDRFTLPRLGVYSGEQERVLFNALTA